ncbi:MAG: chemotaxis protein CheW [Desulfobacterales bacterium]|nr:chemotaxis protein CheW [Desulfobacterales bacterium]
MAAFQFVTFKIDDNLAGIDILKVREINRALDITPVQHAKNYIMGLVNLRGQTVTVFDLSIRLGLSKRIINNTTHNIILKHDNVGLLVDDIGDVLCVNEDEIEPPPANIGVIEGVFIEGLVKLEYDLMIILSAKKILEN